MTRDVWLEETYFDWLRSECFSEVSERREYEGVLRVLHDIPFYFTIWSDENRAGDALSYRRSEFLGSQNNLDSLDQHWLHAWAESSPTVLEVFVGMAHRWSFYFEGSTSFYFAHMFLNMGFERFPGRNLTKIAQDAVRKKCDDWLSRQFEANGDGSPFPVRHALNIVDMRKVDIWGQMNAYSAEHFQ